MKRVTVAAAVLLLLSGCSTAEPSAAPSPAASASSPSASPTATASPEDQFWAYVQPRNNYADGSRDQVTGIGRDICGVLDQAAETDDGLDSAMAEFSEEDKGDNEAMLVGAATYLCPTHREPVTAWYAAQTDASDDADEVSVGVGAEKATKEWFKRQRQYLTKDFDPESVADEICDMYGESDDWTDDVMARAASYVTLFYTPRATSVLQAKALGETFVELLYMKDVCI